MCTDRRVVADIGLKGQGYRPNHSSYILIFGAAQPAWSVVQSDSVMADQPQKVVNDGHICDQIVQRLIKLYVMC